MYGRFFSYIYVCMYAFRCVYYGTVLEAGCVTISSDIERIHFSGKLLKTTQNSLRESLKLTRLTRSFPPRVSNKDSWPSDKPNCEDDSDTQPVSQRKQKLDEPPGKGVGQPSPLERILSNLLRCLKAMKGAPGSRLLWVVTHTGVSFGDFCFCT